MTMSVETLIHELNPVPMGEGPSADSEFAQALLREILTRPIRRVSRPRLRVAAISATAVFALVGTAAAITFWRAPVQDITHMSCFEKASLHTNVDVIAYTDNLLATCGAAMHWPSVPGSSNPHGSLCVLSDGSLAGFPPSRKSDVCATLGLATFNGSLKSLPVAHFELAAQNYFIAHPCVALGTAREQVLGLLKKFEISGWQLRIYGSKSTSACATFGLQAKSRTVDLVGIVMEEG
jgi:hypothetical protein